MNTQTGWMNIGEFCRQRSRFRLQNKPPPRLEGLAYNPYELVVPGTTVDPIIAQQQLAKRQFDLNMRRKAEVLKYSAAATNTKTNGMTKAEKYAHLVKMSRAYSSSQRLAELNQQCSQIETVYHPTSSSGVPGPIMLLYMDETVELYNYTRGIAGNTPLAVENPPNREAYKIVSFYDMSGNRGVPEIDYDVSYGEQWIYSLYLNDSGDREYSFRVPVCFYFSGNATALTKPVTVVIKNVYIYVYYNQTLISTNNETILYTKVYDPPAIEWETFNVTDFTLSVVDNLVGVFEGQVYLGNAHLTGLKICNQKSAVYDVRIEVQYLIEPEGILIEYGTVTNYRFQKTGDMLYPTNVPLTFNQTYFVDVNVLDTTQTTTDNTLIKTSLLTTPVTDTPILFVGDDNGGDIAIGYDGTTEELSDIHFFGNLEFNDPSVDTPVYNIGWIDQLV